MLYRKFASAFLLALSLTFACPILASANFGSGTTVIANELSLIKTALCGERIVFRDTDFKSALGTPDFKEITISSLPRSCDGVLVYRGRRAKVGESIKRRNIPSLVFLPASSEVKEARFSFSVHGFANEGEIECILKFTDRLNQPPTIKSSTAASTSASDKKEIHGVLSVDDPDGDEVRIMVARYPKHGALKLSKDGTYTYLPKKDGSSDSFSFVARDEWGNWSFPLKIKIERKT